MATFDQFVSSLRQEFGEQDAGKKFEVFCKWFLENDPEWSKTVDKVWLWDEYPNKWQRRDLGTDLVFKDKDGLIWAVQAKCYDEKYPTTKDNMNTFLADSGRKKVDRRLWLQTTNKMAKEASDTLTDQDKPVTVFNLNNFRDAQIDYPSSFTNLYQAKVKEKPKPDDHQVKAIEDVTTGLKILDRGQMIMACGTGKTFTTLWIKEALNAQMTLVLLPSLSLLSQTMREWAWAGNTDFEILNVCSDKSVGKKTEDMDPSDAPFAVTSEVHEIASFLQKSGPRVVFCTYQSSALIAEAQINTKVPTFDLAIADEAHRCAGKVDAGFATILDDDKIRSSKRLFMTATPRYFGKAIKDASKASDLAVVGMDDETAFGPVIHQLTFGKAIQDKLLNDYQVVIVGVDEPMVKQWIDNYEIVATNQDEVTDARTLAAKIGMLKAVKDYDLKRVISFHNGIPRAKKFSEEIVEVANLIEPARRPEGQFLSDYVSGKMRAGDRKDKIDRLKVLEGYDIGILTNARCLAEGVDVPMLDGVAFIDPKGSQVDIIQAVGRAIRKVRGAIVQTKGTIVIPVFIEDGDDHEKSIEASNFKPVWEVLKALRAHDEVLADTLDQYRTNMAKNASQNRKPLGDKIIFDIPTSDGAEFSSALRTVLVEASTASWEFWFGLLENYKEREGHCMVRIDQKENGFKIGQWVSTQRKQNFISPKRRQRLNDLGFNWNPYDEIWEHSFKKLVDFKELKGNCEVPLRFSLNGFALGQWVRDQRKLEDIMPADRKQKLEEVGFVWDVLSEAWEKGFYQLLKFKEREGHCNVVRSYKIDGYNLGSWVTNQRARLKIGKLSLERKKRLEQIGLQFSFVSQNKEAWENVFSRLVKFKEREGHCNVPATYKIDGYNLGSWVKNQRQTKGRMPIERKKQLNDLGFIWELKKASWENAFCYLVKFKASEGHCDVRQGYQIEGFALGEWVRSQKRNKDNLSSYRKQRLEEIGFVWTNLATREYLDDAWETGFSKLVQFKESEGHCRVLNGYKLDGYNLSGWVQYQRTTKGSMCSERRKRLDEFGFIWDVNNFDWEQGFLHLKDFVAHEGHAKVPKRFKAHDGYALGSWVSRQRNPKRKELSNDRIKKLDSLGFIWNLKSEGS